MTIQDENLSIVFNGEVYNYIELRAELVSLGHSFRTGTDTEVILAAYSEWGQHCVARFNGMWAFAIYDRPRKIIFCSRDRFGIKPFYYIESHEMWCFGSEIRQLLPLLHEVRANKSVLLDFIVSGLCEPPEDTFFSRIRKLSRGHNAVYDLRTHRLEIVRYYHLAIDEHLGNTPPEEAAAIYGKQLSSAVALRLRADVPVGTCLSGGLDSSTVATLAAGPYAAARGEPFRAITAIGETKETDESTYARKVANAGNMEWIPVRPSYKDFVDSLQEVVRAQEEPFASPSINMQFFVMRAAAENGISVLLDGQGGDETLLGYERYYAAHLLAVLRRKGIVAASNALLDCWRHNKKMSPLTIAQYLGYFSSSRIRYSVYRYRNRYLKARPRMPKPLLSYTRASRDLTTLQKFEIEESNLPPLLRYEDKNSMWHGVETRLPFLDYRAVETALSLPSDTKIFDGWTKYALRRFMNEKLPSEIAWRRGKLGFEAPETLWLTKHADTMFQRVCKSNLILDLSNERELRQLYRHLDRATRWRLYSVALWEKEFSVET